MKQPPVEVYSVQCQDTGDCTATTTGHHFPSQSWAGHVIANISWAHLPLLLPPGWRVKVVVRDEADPNLFDLSESFAWWRDNDYFNVTDIRSMVQWNMEETVEFYSFTWIRLIFVFWASCMTLAFPRIVVIFILQVPAENGCLILESYFSKTQNLAAPKFWVCQ